MFPIQESFFFQQRALAGTMVSLFAATTGGIDAALEVSTVAMEPRGSLLIDFRGTVLWNHGILFFVGVCKGFILPEFHRWCGSSSIHSRSMKSGSMT